MGGGVGSVWGKLQAPPGNWGLGAESHKGAPRIHNQQWSPEPSASYTLREGD